MKDKNSSFEEPLQQPDLEDAALNDRSKRHHPGTEFEKYCSENPDASECRVYDE